MFSSDIGFPRVLVTPPAPPPPPAPVLTQPQQQQLAVRYAPILYFHPDEHNFLQNPQTYLEQSTLRQELDFRGDKELHGLGDVPPEELAGIDAGNKNADSQIFLDHQNEQLGDGIRDGDLGNSVNLYQYDAKSNTITYHLFYSYNDGPPGLGDVQNHEGDWEKVTVQLDSQLQPTEVRYSAHDGMDVARSWADAPKEDGRPVSYVGQGSHANYPEPGTWATNFQVGGAGLVNDVASANGTRFDLAGQAPVDVTGQAWYGGHALWGERGSASEIGIGETSGPTGPSADKGPILDADASREALSGAALIPQFFTNTLPNGIGDIVNWSTGAIGDAGNLALDVGGEVIGGVGQGIDFAGDVIGDGVGIAGDVLDTTVDFGGQVISGGVDIAGDALDTAADFGGDVVDTLNPF